MRGDVTQVELMSPVLFKLLSMKYRLNRSRVSFRTRMAGEQLEDTNLSSTIVNNLEKNVETKCQCCDVLTADIQKAKQDILSYREIIKILLEEKSITQQQQLRT